MPGPVDDERDELARRLRDDYGVVPESLTLGPRGALGQVWRVVAVERVLALKRVHGGTPPSAPQLVAEVTLMERAAAAGVRLPASHAALDGCHLVPLPDGGWLRLHDWVDLHRPDPADPVAYAESVGVLLARLHACAPAADREADGGPPDPWYAVPPPLDAWPPLVDRARATGTAWAPGLAALVAGLPALHALLRPPDPASMLLCHRDLHPDNVLADGSGALVVLDWDNLGPADPAHELARSLWAFFHEGEPDLPSLRTAYAAYVGAGGPARLTSPADLTFQVADQLNFLHRQVGVALDPDAPARDREWAEREIEEGLRTRATPEGIEAVLAALSAGA